MIPNEDAFLDHLGQGLCPNDQHSGTKMGVSSAQIDHRQPEGSQVKPGTVVSTSKSAEVTNSSEATCTAGGCGHTMRVGNDEAMAITGHGEEAMNSGNPVATTCSTEPAAPGTIEPILRSSSKKPKATRHIGKPVGTASNSEASGATTSGEPVVEASNNIQVSVVSNNQPVVKVNSSKQSATASSGEPPTRSNSDREVAGATCMDLALSVSRGGPMLKPVNNELSKTVNSDGSAVTASRKRRIATPSNGETLVTANACRHESTSTANRCEAAATMSIRETAFAAKFNEPVVISNSKPTAAANMSEPSMEKTSRIATLHYGICHKKPQMESQVLHMTSCLVKYDYITINNKSRIFPLARILNIVFPDLYFNY